MNKLTQLRSKANSAGVFFIILSCFFIPFSTSLMGAAAALAAVFWLLSGKLFSLPKLMLNNPVVGLAITLLLLLVAGLVTTPVPLDEAVAFLKKYRELLYFAMVVSLVMDNDRAARRAEDSFIAGCVVLLLVSYGIYFSIIPSERFGHSVVYHITHSFFMAILAFWCLQRIFESRHYIYLWLGLFLAATYNLFYIAPGRTGMLVYVALIFLTVLQRLSWKKSIPVTALVIAIIGVTFVTSTNFSSRVREAVNEMTSYQAESSRTSLGMRFDWWRNSLALIKEKPIFGHGTGSFKTVQAELIKDSDTKPTDNPHNEYLLIAVQTGLVGLLLFVALLATQFLTACKLQPPRKYLLQGVVVAMATGCLMNSFLFDSHPGHFYAMISAILSTPAAKNSALLFRR